MLYLIPLLLNAHRYVQMRNNAIRGSLLTAIEMQKVKEQRSDHLALRAITLASFFAFAAPSLSPLLSHPFSLIPPLSP